MLQFNGLNFLFTKYFLKFQIFAAAALAFGPFSVGLSKGYTSPALASLQQDEANSSDYFFNHPIFPKLTITDQQGSWIAAFSLLGALLGGLASGLLIKMGRRRTIVVTSLPMSLSWTLTMFATRVEMIYVSAFLVGTFSSIVQLATQVYLSEIAHPTIRGSLCSAAKVFSQIGLLASFAMGAWLDWRQLAMVCTGAPLMLLITGHYLPETPSYLILNNQEMKAEKALLWLRGPESDVINEIATIRENIRLMKEKRDSKTKIVWSRLLKPLGITSGMMIFLRWETHIKEFHIHKKNPRKGNFFHVLLFFFQVFGSVCFQLLRCHHLQRHSWQQL